MAKHFFLILLLVFVLVIPTGMIWSGLYSKHFDHFMADVKQGGVVVEDQRGGIWQAGKNALVAIPFLMVAAVLIVTGGFILGRYDFPGRDIIFWFVLVAYLLCATTEIPGDLSRHNMWGLCAARWAGLIAVWTFVLAVCVRSLPRGLFDLATLDGTDLWTDFTHIVLPFTRTILAVMVVALVSTIFIHTMAPRLDFLVNLMLVGLAFVSIQRVAPPDTEDI